MFQRIGIIGGGLMGSGIAEVCARAGLDVLVIEVSEEAATAAGVRIAGSLERAVERGKIDSTTRAETLSRLTTSTDWGLLADRRLIIEAVVENASLKREVFTRVDSIVEANDAILSSNTSSIPIADLATATKRPEAVVGLHFFNPVPVMALVEVVPSILTADDTVDRVARFARESLGKTVVHAADRAGFIVNALLIPYLIDAIRMVEAGHATRDDIDQGMKLGAAHPMGPLELCDLIGNDTVLAVAESLHEEFGEARLTPPALLRRMVGGGLLGRKSGRGFYDY